jgi:hypothetical protein
LLFERRGPKLMVRVRSSSPAFEEVHPMSDEGNGKVW